MDITKTSNGVTIVVGLRVFTNDWAWGTVTAPPAEWDEPGWWEVVLDKNPKYYNGGGQRKTYNGERMTTVEPN